MSASPSPAKTSASALSHFDVKLEADRGQKVVVRAFEVSENFLDREHPERYLCSLQPKYCNHHTPIRSALGISMLFVFALPWGLGGFLFPYIESFGFAVVERRTPVPKTNCSTVYCTRDM